MFLVQSTVIIAPNPRNAQIKADRTIPGPLHKPQYEEPFIAEFDYIPVGDLIKRKNVGVLKIEMKHSSTYYCLITKRL